jgi:hypothetical protein
MATFGTVTARTPSPEQMQRDAKDAASAYWRMKKKSLQDFNKILKTPHQPSDRTRNQLKGYAALLGVDPDKLLATYSKHPIQYSADVLIMPNRDPLRIYRILSGVPVAPSSRGQTFGFHYSHGDLIATPNFREPPIASKKDTMIVVDSKLRQVGSAQNDQVISECRGSLFRLVSLSNHDPLHSINSQPADFQDLNCHFRYGGVEFASIVMHSHYAQTRLLTDSSKLGQLHVMVEKLVENAKSYEDEHKRAYWASLALRHLLLVVPTNHELVDHLLEISQEKLFNGQARPAALARWSGFIENNFLEASKSVASPARNSKQPYDYQASVLTTWFKDYFRSVLSDVSGRSESAQVPWRTFLLLDVLSRGYGIYGIATAVCQNKKLIKLCVDKFRGAITA